MKSIGKAKTSSPSLSASGYAVDRETKAINSTRLVSTLFGLGITLFGVLLIVSQSSNFSVMALFPSNLSYPGSDMSRIEAVSWADPRIFIYHQFLSDAECDYIIQKGLDLGIGRSMVVGAESEEVSTARTSSGRFIATETDPILQRVEERVALWSQLPIENQEQFYLLQYQIGEKYSAHHDYFHGPGAERHIGPGQRTVTVLMYLSDPEEGGETYFPARDEAISVKPKKGDAVLFYSTHPDGSMDPSSLHGSAPVKKGVKYALTKWIRVAAYH